LDNITIDGSIALHGTASDEKRFFEITGSLVSEAG
jgi:hypothetical protein